MRAYSNSNHITTVYYTQRWKDNTKTIRYLQVWRPKGYLQGLHLQLIIYVHIQTHTCTSTSYRSDPHLHSAFTDHYGFIHILNSTTRKQIRIFETKKRKGVKKQIFLILEVEKCISYFQNILKILLYKYKAIHDHTA